MSYLEWPAIELQVCAQADALLLNRYSPISYLLKWRAQHRPTPPGAGQAVLSPHRSPAILWWTRLDSDACLPLFTRTARFDIQPNRFGILGQFGPERKLQLTSTNITSLIGKEGKLMANGSVELEVYVSNASHTLHIFEYTKDNNQKGIQFTVKAPHGGWRMHEWHMISVPISPTRDSSSGPSPGPGPGPGPGPDPGPSPGPSPDPMCNQVPITDTEYSFPMSTPWERMDRLELYYANPAASQPRGDYIRIRNVFLRSSRSYSQRSPTSPQGHQKCSELASVSPASPPSGRDRDRGGPGVETTAGVDHAPPMEDSLAAAGGGDDLDDGASIAESDAYFPAYAGVTQMRRRLLLGFGVPLLAILLAFSFAPHHAAQGAGAVYASCAYFRRCGGCSPEEAIGGSRLGTWLSIVRRKPTRSSEESEQTMWSAGHGARDAHHRNVVG